MNKKEIVTHLTALKTAYQNYAKDEYRKDFIKAIDTNSLNLEEELEAVMNFLDSYGSELEVVLLIKDIAIAMRKLEEIVSEHMYVECLKELDEMIEVLKKPVFDSNKVLALIDKTLKENPYVSVQAAFKIVLTELGYDPKDFKIITSVKEGAIGAIIGEAIGSSTKTKNPDAVNEREKAEQELRERQANQPAEQCDCIGCRIMRMARN